MTKLVMIVPSRGRPQAVAEMYQALVDAETTCAEVVFAVDADDETWPEYRAAADRLPGGLVYVIQQGHPKGVDRIPGVVQPLNREASYYAELFSVDLRTAAREPFMIGFMGDDHRPRLSVVPWDIAYVTELNRLGTGMVYGNDLLQGPNIPTQIAMTSDIIRALGYMAYPGLHHLYADNMWKALGEATGCIRYMPDVVVEHMHPVAGKAEWDDNYARVNAPEIDSHDHNAFADYMANHLADDAAKVRALRTADANPTA